MSSSPRKTRPVNLGEFVRGEISGEHSSPPVTVPKKSRESGQPIYSSVPTAARNRTLYRVSGDPNSPTDGYSASLIDPVMDEKEIYSTSEGSSIMQRHRDAATGYGAMDSHGGGGGGNLPFGSSSVNYIGESFEDEFVKIQMRNEAKRQEHATTNFQTFIHVVKGNIGTGLLALPLAVRNAGLVLGPIGLFVMGIIATHCMILLLESANHLCKMNNMTCLNYAESASVAMRIYTKRKRLIKAAGILVNVFLTITQFGFCCVYFVFLADSLNQVFCEALDITIGKQVWIVIMLVPVVVFCFIRNLESLSPFSLVANMCILFSLLVIFYEELYSFYGYAVDERAQFIMARETYSNFMDIKSVALFFGSVVYAFEGIGMVLPLENKMKTPRSAKPVVYMAMALVTLLYFIFGTTGYLVYGTLLKGSITLNLSSSTRLWAAILFIIVKLFFAYAIFASYLLQFYVPMDFLEPSFFDLIKADRLPYYFPRYHEQIKTGIQYAFRTVLVILTAIIAIVVPDLEDLIALIGAVASSALALIFPALLEIAVFWPDRHERKFLFVLPWEVWVVKDCLILLLGIAGLMLGTYASISNIIQNIGAPEEQCRSIYRH